MITTIPLKVTTHGPREKFAIILDNVLTPEECQLWIDRAERKGYEVAVINGAGGRTYHLPNERLGERCIIDDSSLTDIVFQRIGSYLPEIPYLLEYNYKNLVNAQSSLLVGLNERLRFLKYSKGGYFKPHWDGCYIRPDGNERSWMTAMIYLNDGEKDFQGGATCLLNVNRENGTENHMVVPKPGRVLVFDHDIYHEGQTVENGTKLCVRTDVMYHDQPFMQGRIRK